MFKIAIQKPYVVALSKYQTIRANERKFAKQPWTAVFVMSRFVWNKFAWHTDPIAVVGMFSCLG